jgi:hypothetical protein
MNGRYLIGLISLFLLASCANPKQNKTDSIDKQIMDTHDEVMPRMGEVLRLRKQIQAKLDSCQTPACTDTLNQLSYALTKADADMMKWMHAYKKPEASDTTLTYLEGQLKEIERVKTQILEGIAQATSYLNVHEN